MANLRLIIKPYYKEIIVPIEQSFYIKIINAIKKERSSFGNKQLNIPDVGFQGLVLSDCNYDSILFYDNQIVFKYGNVSSLLFDKNKKYFNRLLGIMYKKKYKEINYFFEVKKYFNDKKKFNNNQKYIFNTIK